MAVIQARGLGKDVRRQARGRGPLVRRPPGQRDRLPGPQRCRQVDHDAADARPRPRRGHDDVRRPALHRADPADEQVGALLEAKPFHPTRTARNHLRMLAAANGIATARVDEVLEQLGLAAVARKKPKTFSLGMGQRLGLAAALLGDPRHADPRRARQRPRPAGHPVDPRAAQGASRRPAGRCSSPATCSPRWR